MTAEEVTKTLKELYECREEIKIGNSKIIPSLMRRAVRGSYSLDDIALESIVRISTAYDLRMREIPIYLGQIAHIGHDNYRDVWLFIKKND